MATGGSKGSNGVSAAPRRAYEDIGDEIPF